MLTVISTFLSLSTKISSAAAGPADRKTLIAIKLAAYLLSIKILLNGLTPGQYNPKNLKKEVII